MRRGIRHLLWLNLIIVALPALALEWIGLIVRIEAEGNDPVVAAIKYDSIRSDRDVTFARGRVGKVIDLCHDLVSTDLKYDL